MGTTIEAVQGDRIKAARTFAEAHQLHVVLKGHRTLIAAPEGSVAINMTGNPGMATGGTGDVLTGVIAGWFGQLLDAEGAARLGVYLHGHAGDLAMADLGEAALTASDLLTYLGDAVLELSAERTPGEEARRGVSAYATSSEEETRQVAARLAGELAARDRDPAARRPRRGQDRLRPRIGGGTRRSGGRGQQPHLHPGARVPGRPVAAVSRGPLPAARGGHARRTRPRRGRRGRRPGHRVARTPVATRARRHRRPNPHRRRIRPDHRQSIR